MHKIVGSEPFDQFFEDEPVFICAYDGKAVFQNPAADALMQRMGSAFCLLDAVSPSDAVKYEILMNSNKPRPYMTAANVVPEYDSLRITPIDVGDYRMSIAVLCRKESKKQECSKPSVGDMSRLLLEIGTSEKLTEHLSPSKLLFDMRTMTARIVSELSERTNTALEWTEPDAGSVMPSDISERMYTYMVCAALSALSDVAVGGGVSVFLEEAERDYCLRFSSPYMGVTSPAAEAKFSLVSFIAENCGCAAESLFSDDRVSLSLRVSHVTEVPNFKSHDQFAEFEANLSAALRAVEIICREADQASEQARRIYCFRK